MPGRGGRTKVPKARKFSGRLSRWLEADHPRGAGGKFRVKAGAERKALTAAPKRQPGQHADEIGPKGISPAFVMGDDGEFHQVKKVKGVAVKVREKPKQAPASSPKPDAKPSQSKPPVGSGSRGDLGTLQSRLTGKSAPDAINETSRWIDENKSSSTSPVRNQGMTVAEDMYSVRLAGKIGDADLDGVTIHYSKSFDATENPAARTIAALKVGVYPVNIPKQLSKHTKNIYFTTQETKYQSHFEQVVGKSGVTVEATAGDGNVTIYGGRAISSRVLAHEMGHNLAAAKYGKTTPSESSEFTRAGRGGEEPPTTYGKTNPGEDFAESVGLYAVTPGVLAKSSPRRHAIIKRLMEEDSYGG